MTHREQIAGEREKTTDIIQRTVQDVVAGLSAIAAADRNRIVPSIGRVFQATIAGRFLKQLSLEWEQFRRAGRIKDDYDGTPQSRACLAELLRALESDIPDETRMDILKKIFLVAATEEDTDRDSLLPQQLMEIATRLSAGEILVLTTTYRIVGTEQYKPGPHYGATQWLSVVAEQSGLEQPELVELHERKLIDKNLLTRRLHSDGSGVNLGKHFRLTDLGYRLCTFVQHYEDLEGRAGSNGGSGLPE